MTRRSSPPTTCSWWAGGVPGCAQPSASRRRTRTRPGRHFQGLPDAQPHRLRGRRRGRRHRRDDTIEEHIYDTISGSDWLGDQDAIEAFVHEAPRELLQLEHWGCPWSRQPDGHVAVRPFGGMKKKRTWFAADKTGFHMLHTLFQTSLKYGEVARYDEWFVTRLLVDDGRVHGVVAVELRTGRIRAIAAKSSSWPPAAAARSSRSPPTPTSTPATACPWPTARARR